MAGKSLGSASLLTSVDLSGLTSGLARGAAMVQTFGNRINTSMQTRMNFGQRLASGFRRQFAQMGAISGRFSLMNPTAILGGLGVAGALRGFARFESSMSQVRTLSQATGEEFQQLWGLAEQLGATTQFTAGQAAEGMRELALQGRAVDDILSAMPGLLNFAASGGMSLAESTRIAGTALNVFELDASQMPMVADVMTQGFTNSAMGMEDLGQAFLYGAGQARLAGMSINEFTGVLMTFAQGGDIGTRAGRQFRQGMARLQGGTARVQRTLRELGVDVKDSAGSFRPIADVIDDLQWSLSRYPQVQRNAMVATIFGTESMNAWSTAIRLGGDEIRRNTALTQVAGRAEEVAAARMDNLAGSWIEFTSALSGATNLISKNASPALRGLLSGITSLLRSFAAMSPETQRWITGAMAMAAAMLSVTVILPRLVMGVRMLGVALGLASGGLGFVITGIGLIAGAIAMMDPADRLQLFAEAWATIKATLDAVWGALRPVVDSFLELFGTSGSALMAWFTNIDWMETFSQGLLTVGVAVGNIVDAFIWLRGVVEQVLGLAIEQLGAMHNAMQRVANVGSSPGSGLWFLLTGNSGNGPANLLGDPNQANIFTQLSEQLSASGAAHRNQFGNSGDGIIGAWQQARESAQIGRQFDEWMAAVNVEVENADIARQFDEMMGQVDLEIARNSFQAAVGQFPAAALSIAGLTPAGLTAAGPTERQIAEHRVSGANLAGTGASAEIIARALYAPRVTEEQRRQDEQRQRDLERNRLLEEAVERLAPEAQEVI